MRLPSGMHAGFRVRIFFSFESGQYPPTLAAIIEAPSNLQESVRRWKRIPIGISSIKKNNTRVSGSIKRKRKRFLNEAAAYAKGGTMRTAVLRTVLSALGILFAATSSSDAATAIIKLGLDTAGTQEVSATYFNFYFAQEQRTANTSDVNNGISLATEIEGEMTPFFDLGAGFELQSPRRLSDYEGKFSFLPIYGFLKIHPRAGDLTPYVIGQFGVAVFIGDDHYVSDIAKVGGMSAGTNSGETRAGSHVGVGGGLVFNRHYQIELLFTADSGSIVYPYHDYYVHDADIVYTKTTLSLGYRF
jgi:hypothetical protein